MSPSSRGSPGVTAVIAAHDESANIEACIASVEWAGEVIVVENDSLDDTVALASAAGATVIRPPFTTIGASRNQAIIRAKTPWVFVLDADERCTPELAKEILDRIRTTDCAAYRVPRRSFFLGKEIRYGGWGGGADKPIRLFRRDLRYNANQVHEHVDVPAGGAIGELRNSLLHYTYASLDQYFEKFGRYSRWWAEQNHARGRRGTAAAIFFKPPAKFVSMYLLKGGFRDGARGLVLASLAAASVMAKYARLWERSIRHES
ncbi:MAG: glycosyltransferase family 2 protein [Gemmatimonadota bacterium]|nr:glycosyltransferase family 2 protein [Gemmatimonadota bacterium]